VLQNEVYRFGSFCQDRFEHGRSFARDRLARGDGAPRWLCAAATPVLPFLLGRRVAASAGAADKGTFLRALPFTLSFLGAWSVGELAGYLQGAEGGAGERERALLEQGEAPDEHGDAPAG
jgi:hypothetical protein